MPTRIVLLSRLVCFLVLSPAAFAQTPAPAPQSPQAPQTLTLEEVLRMTKDGQADELIIIRIKRSGKAFDLNSAEITELQQLGVSDAVMKYLIDPSQPYSPPPPPAAVAAPTPSIAAPAAPSPAPVAPPPSRAKPPSDPLVLKLPPEMGLYWLNEKEQPVQLELKPVVISKQTGKSKLTLGLKKGSNVGSIPGLVSKLTIPAGPNAFYARVQTAMEDLVLVKLEPEEGRRDLDIGPNAAKPTFPPKSVRPFEAKDVGQGVTRITLPMLEKGEYLLFILGSGEEKKSTLGKGWEFGVQ